MRPVQLQTLALRASAALLALGWLVAMMMPVGAEPAGSGPRRIVAIGGSVTEIVYALGEQDRLAGRDTTSVFPPEALALPELWVNAVSEV